MIEGITEDNPPMHLSGQCICQSDPVFVEEKKIQQENVVIGALESAFQECVSYPTFFFIIVPRIELCCIRWERNKSWNHAVYTSVQFVSVIFYRWLMKLILLFLVLAGRLLDHNKTNHVFLVACISVPNHQVSMADGKEL